MLSVTIERNFSAAHRIEGHPKCGRLHGHNYRVLASFTGPVVEPGYIADFADLKKLVDQVVDRVDHRYIISRDNRIAHDPYAHIALTDRPEDAASLDIQSSSAEALAEWFFEEIAGYMERDEVWEEWRTIELVKVVVYETPTGYAEVN